MGDIKIDLMSIITTVLPSIIMLMLRSTMAKISKNTEEVIKLRAEFDIFKQRTDDVPELQKDVLRAHRRINEIEEKL